MLIIQGLFILIYAILCSTQKLDINSISNVVEFSNKLVPKLFKEFYQMKENLVISPFGIATNLVMAMEGLDNKISDEIAIKLKLQPGNQQKQLLRHGFRTLLDEFQVIEGHEETAGSYNRAIIRSSLPLIPAYYDLLKTFYKANITQTGEHKINSSTNHALELQSDTGVMSHWKDYDKLSVYTYLKHQPSAPFTSEDGEIFAVPMIPQVGAFHVGKLLRLNSHAVELLFEADSASLFLIMPDINTNISELIQRLENEKLSLLSKSLPVNEVEVAIPQFAVVTSDLNLNDFLIKIGLPSRLFVSQNKLSKNKNKIQITALKQNAYFAASFVNINTVGSSGLKISKYSTTSNKQKREIKNKLSFDRPFIFFVLHRHTGLILLAGIVQKPTQVPK